MGTWVSALGWALSGAFVAAVLVLAGTADWEYLLARHRGRRNLRRARRRPPH